MVQKFWSQLKGENSKKPLGWNCWIIQPLNILVGGFKETWMGMHCSAPILKKETVLALNLAELHVFVLRNFIQFNRAPTKFNEALTKPYHGLMQVSL